MTNAQYRLLIKKVNDYLEKANPNKVVMIENPSENIAKIFEYDYNTDYPYYEAAQYMLALCMYWISSDTHSIDDDFTAESLLEDCIDTNDFGDVMKVYIRDEDFNFIGL